jgi:hypothetical protein
MGQYWRFNNLQINYRKTPERKISERFSILLIIENSRSNMHNPWQQLSRKPASGFAFNQIVGISSHLKPAEQKLLRF